MATASFSLSPSPFSRSDFRPSSTQARLRIPCRSDGTSLSPLSRTLSAIESSGVIACLRASSGDLAREAAQAALSGGISVLEIVMSTPGVFEVLEGLVQDHPTSIIGVGTVLNALDARKAIKAGARFLMSPVTVKDILEDIQGGEILYIPGVMTPTELWAAYNSGARVVKVYPISALGGTQYISSLKKPFPHIPMVASQGITLDSIGTYIAGGASAVVLSDAIFDKEAMCQQNFDTIYQLAQLAALQGHEAVQRKKRCMLSLAS
ncbi:PREDICTED: uncharacterized protein LOC104593651 isoform X2 [Nelumbo nucifera]|uniref:KHG/KDPG aldolase n=2 Tax=Nelumbo nucifera TaxID=4432 RepID=A0A822Z9M0_NELNU|nr:PREDICTED: uncharacterized protein LOC104593651 isoform X2 [Nelumbo nucifera]DAD42994.1 TPA_asm: hypothetical protein HUJ06_001224 [Nelumbo nucifera]